MKSFTKADLLNGTLFTILRPVHYEQPAYLDRGVFLKLTNLTMADQGLYTCLAMSVHMGFSYRSAFLTVNQPFKSKFLFTQSLSNGFLELVVQRSFLYKDN